MCEYANVIYSEICIIRNSEEGDQKMAKIEDSLRNIRLKPFRKKYIEPMLIYLDFKMPLRDQLFMPV